MPDPLTDKRVLFLAPGFLSMRLHKTVRGVQVFDLRLVRQLGDLGIRVAVPAESSWKNRFSEHLDGAVFEPVYTPNFRKPIWNTLAAAMKLRGRSFDAVIIGNPARGLCPGLRLLHRSGCFDRATLIAHRPVRAGFARRVPACDLRAIAVNTDIAAQAATVLGVPVQTYYGIANADLFSPANGPRKNGPVRLVAVGQLANEWKGAQVAVDAFRALDPGVREKCELHLASFPDGREFPEKNIHTYRWMSVGKIADLLRTMDIMLVPSLEKETFSQVFVQGMLTGLPIISSDMPVLAEKLDTGGGIVCSDHEQYVRAITELATNPAMRREMGAKARATAQDRYIWDTAHFVRTFLFQDTD